MGKPRLRLVWSPEAEEDLISIWRYGSEEWAPSVADEHEQASWRACNRLLENLELGRPRQELAADLRSILVDPHVVFYRITPTAVEIVRLVHQHEDVTAIFH